MELNVNGAQQLQSLNVQGCHLESLSVDSCENLKNLYCGYNKLSLNLFGTVSLSNLNIDDNEISNMLFVQITVSYVSYLQ